MFCGSCRTVISDTAKHCPNCGTSTKTFLAADPSRPTAPSPAGGYNPTGTPTTNAPAAPSGDKTDDPLLGRVLPNRYRLVQRLGQGGMGVVYRAEHVRIHRPAAIKVLNAELSTNPEFVARFEREAEMASLIKHENAVEIYDFGEAEDGLVYLTMEFLDGVPLSSIIKDEGPLPLDRTVHIIWQAAEALQAAHELEIIHRDLKPDNIMICKKPRHTDWVEVVDFGLAKGVRVDSNYEKLTQVGFVLGTPDYMSPEQVSGDDLDRRSDLYSLAVVTYEMLTAAFPFEGSMQQKRMIKRLTDMPKPVRQLNPSLPLAVEKVLMRALSREVEDRYDTTIEFATALKLASSDRATQPVQPRPVQPRPSPPQPPAQPQPTAPRQSVRLGPEVACSRCGSRVESGLRFCNECGTPISGPFSTTPSNPPQPNPINTPVNVAANTNPSFQQPFPATPGNPSPVPFMSPAPAPMPLPRSEGHGGKKAAIIVMSLIAVAVVSVAIYLYVTSGPGRNDPTPAEKLATSLRNAIAAGRLVTLSDDDARTYYLQLREIQPGHPALTESASSVLQQLRQQGEEVFKKKKAVSSDVITPEEWTRTLRVYEWAKALDNKDRTLEARWRFAEGEVAKQQGRKDDAERSYTAAAQLDSAWALPYNSLGLLRVDNKRYQDATNYYQKAIDLDPNWEIPYNNMGSAYFLMRDYDTAEGYYTTAIEKNPNWARPHYWIGSIYQNRGWNEEAIEQYEIALKLDPNGDINNDMRKRIERLRSTGTQ